MAKTIVSAKKYLDANIAFMLKNSQGKGRSFKQLVSYAEDRLNELGKNDMTDAQIESYLKDKVKIAKKIFSDEAKFQGKGEFSKEFNSLAKKAAYSFQS